MLQKKVGLVGGTWDPQNGSQAFLPLDQSLDVSKVEKTKTMLEMYVWDPSTKSRHGLSVCSVPIKDNWAGVGSVNRGNWYMMEVLGLLLSQSKGLIRAIVCDAAGAHTWIKRCLHGNHHGLINAEDLRSLPFWSELRYESLWETCLPRLPIFVCKHHGEVIYGIAGPCATHFA